MCVCVCVFGVPSDLFYDSHRVSSLSSETLPLLCVTFITENSLVAAVSIKNFFILLYLETFSVYLIGKRTKCDKCDSLLS